MVGQSYLLWIMQALTESQENKLYDYERFGISDLTW